MVEDPSTDELQTGEALDRRYRILRRIGSGAMGIVYAAHHVGLDREVALKVIARRHALDATAIERFRREGRVSARAKHPNIVDVIDLGQADGRWYLAMELLQGIDLADAIQIRRGYEPAEVVPIVDQLLSGLEAAHELGVVHRDLKPENVFLAHTLDGELLVKIVDFGVVKICNEDARDQLTRTGAVVGTPHYMAPEQARGKDVDARSDLYSVGCILYQMLCGRPPFNDQSLLLVLSKQFGEVPRPPSELRPGLTGAAAIDRFVGRALEKDPARRFQSAAEMRRELAVLATELGSADAPQRKLTFESLRLTPPRAPEGSAAVDLPQTAPSPKASDPEVVRTPAPPVALRSAYGPIVLAAILGACFAGGLVYLLLRGSFPR